MTQVTESTEHAFRRKFQPTQEGIVVLLTLVLIAGFSLKLDNFLTYGNAINLLRGVSVLGMLGLGMCIVVVGRGIDLSIVATMVVGMCWALKMTNEGYNFAYALLLGGGFALATGVVIGVVIAFAEIPAVFTTLVMGSVIFGVGNAFFFSADTHNAPEGIAWLQTLGFGSLFGVPFAIYVFGVLALIIHAILRYTRLGRSIYAIGDNAQAARIAGLPVRPVIVAQYALSGLISFAVGLVIVASNSGMNTRLVYTTLVYDVLLVVVLGGIGLSGGRGGVRNVVVGTLMVGTLVSGMTIMNLSYTEQNVVKSLVMLASLVAETLINPRDEQTSQQGDI
jgi:ribose transport system permease protein